jgi:hypothetical protein
VDTVSDNVLATLRNHHEQPNLHLPCVRRVLAVSSTYNLTEVKKMVDPAVIDPVTNAIAQLMILGWGMFLFGVILPLVAPIVMLSGFSHGYNSVPVIVHRAAMLI